MVESYGIPEPEANAQALQAIAMANGMALRQVAVDAVTPLVESITENDSLLGYVGSTLKKSLAGSAGAQKKQLGKVAKALADDLIARTGVMGVQLAAGLTGLGPGQASDDVSYPDSAFGILPESLSPQSVPATVAGGTPAPVEGAALWGVYRTFVGPGWGPCSVGPWVTEGLPAGTYSMGGPFTDEQSAVEFSLTATDCVSGAPLGGGTIPPPPPPPPEPCKQCCCCPCTCSPVKAEPPPPTKTPEEIEDEELNPLPVPVLPRLAPVAQCGLTPSGKLPAVGSPEFCACIIKLKEWAVGVGQAAVDTFFGARSQDGTLGSGFIDALGSSLLGLDNLLLVGSLKIGTEFQSFVAQVKPLWRAITEVTLTAPICNPLEVLGLQLAQALIKMLRSLKVGWTFGVEISTVIEITLPQLESVLRYLAEYTCPTEIPSVPDAIECYLQHTAAPEHVRCWLAMRGVDMDVWMPVVMARRDKLTPPELIQLYRRRERDVGEQEQALARQGWLVPEEAAARVELYDELPTISDHLHWLQRNVFDDAYVKDYELMKGFEDRFWTKFGKDLRAQGMLKTSAELHYAAHWLNPAPGELREMVFRLRPDKDGVENPFTPEDYERILNEKDVGPYFQRRFREILYRIPALTYLRDMHRAGLLTDDQMREYHRDLGYTESDSELFVKVDALRKNKMRASEGSGWTPAAMAKAYAVNLISEEEVRDRMDRLGYHPEEITDMLQRSKADLRHSALVRSISRTVSSALDQVKQAQQVGIMTVEQAASAITALGYSPEASAGIATANEATMRTSLVKRAIGRVRSAYLRGEVDGAYARRSLFDMRVAGNAIDLFLSQWALEQTPYRRRRTARQVMSDWSAAELSEDEATARLGNLGYEPDDIRLWFAEQDRKDRKAAQKEATAAARGAEAEARRKAREEEAAAGTAPEAAAGGPPGGPE